MKVNKKVFSIPPHVSTTWGNIAAIHMKGSTLIVTLIDGETIEIPELSPEGIAMIFETHADVIEEMEKEQSKERSQETFPFQQLFMGNGEGEFPFRFGISTMDGLGAVLQHNPEHMNAPDLPEEVLAKVHSIAKIIVPEDTATVPKPEPHCNCMHCQIARAINMSLGNPNIYEKHEESTKVHEESTKVSDDDLTFQQWDIQQIDDKLYAVTSRLDVKERYNVYLGQPVGCTCGKEGCEHIIAVLKS